MKTKPASFACDPQDLEATMGWMLTAIKERDLNALDNLFWKLREQVDLMEEDMIRQIADGVKKDERLATLERNNEKVRQDNERWKQAVKLNATKETR